MKVVLILSISVSSFNLFSQVTQEWVKRYNGPANYDDDSRDIAVDRFRNVYVTGFSDGNGTGPDYATVKYNTSGIQQWVARYNGSLNSADWAHAIAVDDSGNCYITGYSGETGTGRDITTVKYSTSGVQQWVKRYNGPGNGNDLGWELVLDDSGNVYVTGWSWGTAEDFTTIKYNSSGVEKWVARYNGPQSGGDFARSIAVDDSGNVYITGYGVIGSIDFITIKYNSAGVQQWVVSYNGTSNGADYAYGIAVDGSGNVYIIGHSQETGQMFNYTTIKYSSTGVQQWLASYNGPGNGDDIARWIKLDDLGNVYVTGSSLGMAAPEYATVKYSSSGVQQWAARYICGYPRAIELDGSGNVYVTGYICVVSGGTFDFGTVKYNSSGVMQWAATYNGAGDSSDYGWAMVLDSVGNVYVTGASFGNGTEKDFATVKYSQSIGIQNISGEIPFKYNLYQNYPNPFNPITTLEFRIMNYGFVTIKVFDLQGREITTLVNDFMRPGTYNINFDGSPYASGVYFCKLTSGDFLQTRKMVLVK